MKRKLICMAFDGDYQTERPIFDSEEAAWDYANDLGSKWYFYPFYFLTTASGKTVAAAPDFARALVGKRVKTVARFFRKISLMPEMEGADVDRFSIEVFYRGQP